MSLITQQLVTHTSQAFNVLRKPEDHSNLMITAICVERSLQAIDYNLLWQLLQT
jgi:hypothetical protein